MTGDGDKGIELSFGIINDIGLISKKLTLNICNMVHFHILQYITQSNILYGISKISASILNNHMEGNLCLLIYL